MLIDLRTAVEKRRHPRRSNIEIEVPLPPLTDDMHDWLKKTLLSVAADSPDEKFRVFCAKGNRSRIAARILRDAGYQVSDLGGF